MKFAEARFAIGRMYSPIDGHSAGNVTDLDLADWVEFTVGLLFVFEDSESCSLRPDSAIGCRLECPLRARQRVDICGHIRKFRADKIEIVVVIAAYRIADARDADRRMNSVLALGHECALLSRTLRRLLWCCDAKLIPKCQADWWIRLRDWPGDGVVGFACAGGAGRSASEFDPQIGQSQTVSDRTLRGNDAGLAHAGVVESHAAVEQDHVEIGAGVAQLQLGLGIRVVVGYCARLDLVDRIASRILDLVDEIEQLRRGFLRRLDAIRHHPLVGVADLAIAALVEKSDWRCAR